MMAGMEAYRGRSVLITGGLGMIGSTIAHRLVAAGADVTIADSCLEPYGANLFNLDGIEKQVQVSITDIRDRSAMHYLVRGKDVIFNLAGQVSHNDSLEDPYLDAEINYIGHLNVLESVRRHHRSARVVNAGSRLQYGPIERNPVSETHPLRPKTPYAFNKTAAEGMYAFYHETHGIRTTMIRIANPYGPRSQMKHAKYTIVNWFIRRAMEGQDLMVYGDGSQVRDYIYVDDLADAITLAAVEDTCVGQVYNIGSGKGHRFCDMVKMVLEAVQGGTVKFVPWPSNYINVETGDYVADIRKLASAIPWQPTVDLREGIARTFRYYRENRTHYW